MAVFRRLAFGFAPGGGTRKPAPMEIEVPPEPAPVRRQAPGTETTMELTARAHTGDPAALEVLLDRCLPLIQRWALGRLPHDSCDLAHGLIQETVLRSLTRLQPNNRSRQGALQAYLRRAVADRLRDETRRLPPQLNAAASNRVQAIESPSRLEHAIGREGLERYEAGLDRLTALDREAIIARFEFHQSYGEIAIAIAQPDATSARVTVVRALRRLIEEMDNEG